METNVRQKSFARVLSIVVLTVFLFTQTAFAAETASSDAKSMEYLKSVMDMIKEKYNGQVSDEQLIEGALKGMFNTMDPYTVFFNPSEAEEFLSDVEGTYVGIGIAMTKAADDSILISNVFSASPAEKAGLVSGDKIVSVNGKGVAGVSMDEVVTLVRGQEDTEVVLGIIKSGQSTISTVKVLRAPIKVNPVVYEIRDGIGYVRIDSFNANTGEYLEAALKEIDSKNITNVVLDLRNNPGGEVDQAVDVARKFVPEGLITKLDYKSEEYRDQQYMSSLKQSKYKLVVLVNERSASASEILAGAIQDTKAGTLVGTKTFGKAKVQVLIPMLTSEAYAKYEKQVGAKILNAYDLINKYQLSPTNDEVVGWTKITVGQYTTPKGRMIDQVGLEPDVKVGDYKPVMDIDVNGISKLTQTVKPTLNSEGLDVYNAEKILKISGYDIDKPDTKLDEKTFNAIKKFQKDNGVSPYGVLDFTTQKLMNEKLGKLLLSIDLQYAKAVELLKAN